MYVISSLTSMVETEYFARHWNNIAGILFSVGFVDILRHFPVKINIDGKHYTCKCGCYEYAAGIRLWIW